MWFVVFQGNFMFFVVFAVFSYILLPQFEGIHAYPWVHTVGSILPATLFMLGADRGLY